MFHLTTQFIFCPKCSGSGKQNQKICDECSGIGLGTFMKNDFLYWGYSLTDSNIIIRQSRQLFNKIINIVIFIVGCVGVISLLFWMGGNTFSPEYKIYIGRLLTFWSVKEVRILIFWLGMLAFLFFYFRRLRLLTRHVAVKNLKYWQYQKFIKITQHIPNNWREMHSFRTKIDVSNSYEEELIQTIEKAYLLADSLQHVEFNAVHVLIILLGKYKEMDNSASAKIVRSLFGRLNIHNGEVVPGLQTMLNNMEKKSEDNLKRPTEISSDLRQALVEAYLLARDNKRCSVHVLDLLLPLLSTGTSGQSIIQTTKLNMNHVRNGILWFNYMEKSKKQTYRSSHKDRLRLQKKMRRATLAVATPILSYFSDNLSEEMRSTLNIPVWAERPELWHIYEYFIDKHKHILLYGEENSGKDTLVHLLAEKIIEDDVPKMLRSKEILRINMQKIKTSNPNIPLDKKMILILQEANANKNVILYIPDVTDEVMRIISDFGTEVMVIATSAQKIDNSKIRTIHMSEPKNFNLLHILLTEAINIETKYKVYFSYDAIAVAMYTAQIYMHEGSLIINGLHILQQAAANATQQVNINLNDVFVAKIAASITGVPYTKIIKSREGN